MLFVNDKHSAVRHSYFFAAVAVAAAAVCVFFLSGANEWWEFVSAIVMGALAIAAVLRAVQSVRRQRS